MKVVLGGKYPKRLGNLFRHRACAAMALPKLARVELTVAHGAHKRLDLRSFVGETTRQPLAKNWGNRLRQPEHRKSCMTCAGLFRCCQNRGYLAVVESGNDRRYEHADRNPSVR